MREMFGTFHVVVLYFRTNSIFEFYNKKLDFLRKYITLIHFLYIKYLQDYKHKRKLQSYLLQKKVKNKIIT